MMLLPDLLGCSFEKCGLSSSCCKNLSIANLNDSTDLPVMFLICFGSAFHAFVMNVLKVLVVLVLFDGMRILPLLEVQSGSINKPVCGTIPSIIFHP